MTNQSSGLLNIAEEVVLVPTGAAGSVGVQVVNSFSGTLSFEGTVNGSAWSALSLTPVAGGTAVTSTTAAGQWSGRCAGLLAVRVRMSAYTSGNAQVSMLATTATTPADGVALPLQVAADGDPVILNAAGDTVFSVDASGNPLLTYPTLPLFTRTGGVDPFPTMTLLPSARTLVNGATEVYDTGLGVVEFLPPSDATTVASANVTALGYDGISCQTWGGTGIAFPALTSVSGSVNLSSATALETVDLGAVVTIGGSFSCNGCTALTSLDLGSIESVGVSVDFDETPLTTVALPALSTCGGDLLLTTMPNLTTLDVPNLEVVGGTVTLSICDALVTADFPVLSTAASLEVTQNGALETIGLDALTTVSDVLSFIENPTLGTLDLPVLTDVGGVFGVADHGVLLSLTFQVWDGAERIETVDLSALTTTGTSGLSVTNNSQLQAVDLSALTSVGGTVDFRDTISLTTFALPSLLAVSSDVYFNDGGNGGGALNQASVDGLLVALAALDGTGGTTTFDNLEVNLSQGTNAMPSGAGLTAKATLEGRGNTVFINRTYAITAVNTGTPSFTVSGDKTAYFTNGVTFVVFGSTGNDATYTVVSSAFGAATVITVDEAIPDGTVDGTIRVASSVP